MRETRGYAKQGVGYGYNKIKGLNALLGIVSTPVSAPIIVGHRLRKGAVNSARGARKFLADAIKAARRAGAGPVIRCRADSAFYNHSVVTAILAAKAQFSITARMDKAVQKAISSIPDTAWVHIKYPEAIFDDEQQRWISDAQVAETGYTAFTSKARKHQVTARLIVRRVKRLNPKSAPAGQDELFSVYRHHAVFRNATEPMLLAEAHHRDHAIVEQVIADLKSFTDTRGMLRAPATDLAYIFASRSPGLVHPAVPDRPDFVEAAPTFPSDPRKRLPPASPHPLRRQGDEGPPLNPAKQRLVAHCSKQH